MAQLIIDVPDELAAKVAEAMRTTYPDVIATAYPGGGETDAQAWRAVAAFWTASVMADFEADRVRQVADEGVAQAVAQRDAAVQQARDLTWAAVNAALRPPEVTDE